MAKVKIGIGNKPFLRGEGPGLSWEEGVPMNFVEIGKWSWSPSDKEAPLAGIARAMRATTGTLVALQRNPNPGEIDAFADAAGRQIHDLTDLNETLEDMLALVGLLDDYICVSNSNVHLRAATGRPCRVLVPSPPEFRWMAAGDESPWFPGTRVYRQHADGDWDQALAALANDMKV